MNSSLYGAVTPSTYPGGWNIAAQRRTPSLLRHPAAESSPHALLARVSPAISGGTVATTFQPRDGIIASAAPAASGVGGPRYSRSSWRTTILQEDGDTPDQTQQQQLQDVSSPAVAGAAIAADSSGSRGTAVDASQPGADGGEEPDGSGAYGGTLTAAELRVKLSLAGGSGRLDLTDCRLREVPPQVLELTELEELQLSGNCLTELPEGLSRLTALRRLGLAGNLLTALPPGIGALTGLEGLWLHGNMLASLPEQLGRLGALRALSLAGNCLESVPPGSLSGLTSLTDLTLAGNRLTHLPAGELAPLSRLRKLALNGNRLVSWRPGEVGLGRHMTALAELMMQGNCLTEVDPAVFECPALSELSLADNQLQQLPPSLACATSLARLHLFGNRLTFLAGRQLASLPALSACWLEGNPLTGPAVAELLSVAGGGGMPRLKALGLDQQQLAAAQGHLQGAAAAAAGQRAGGRASAGPSDGARLPPPPPLPSNVRVGCVLGSGPGYFKLQYGPQRPGAPAGAGSGANGDGGDGGEGGGGLRSSNELLVVAFGSAPGTPNWGGLLSKVYRAATADSERYFDVLYVADPTRDWYGGGDDATYAYYRSRLSCYTRHYRRVLLLGDSMGATAALLFADLATAALAFCPQVDLTAASIRPGRPATWLDRLRGRLMSSVRASAGELVVLVGTWQHDLAQANLLPQSNSHQQQQKAEGRAREPGTATGAERSLGERGGPRGAAARSWRAEASAEADSAAASQLGLFSEHQRSGSGAARAAVGSAAHRRPWAWQRSKEEAAGEGAVEGSGLLPASSRASPDDGYGDCDGGVNVRVFSVDSHRLAAALDTRGQLVPLVRDMVLHQLGLRSGNVRVSNLL